MSESDDRIYGWKAIADALGVSRAKAVELANPMRKFQLPVRYGVRGIYITRAKLNMWVEHYDTPYGLHGELK